MKKEIGVARISRPTQNIQRQIRNIKNQYPNANIIKIVYTGSKVTGYKDFINVVDKLEEGDTLIFDSASRMSRDSKEGCDLYEKLFNRNVKIVFLKEPHINTDVYKEALDNQIKLKLKTGNKATDELMNSIIDALNKYTIALAKEQIKVVFDQAEKELQDLHQRTSEGIETARLDGKQIGQIKGRKLNVKKAQNAKAVILKHSKDFHGTLTDDECRKLAGVSRNSFYKYKGELKNIEI